MFSEEALEGDPALIAAGWERRFMADGQRVGEAVCGAGELQLVTASASVRGVPGPQPVHGPHEVPQVSGNPGGVWLGEDAGVQGGNHRPPVQPDPGEGEVEGPGCGGWGWTRDGGVQDTPDAASGVVAPCRLPGRRVCVEARHQRLDPLEPVPGA